MLGRRLSNVGEEYFQFRKVVAKQQKAMLKTIFEEFFDLPNDTNDVYLIVNGRPHVHVTTLRDAVLFEVESRSDSQVCENRSSM